MTWRRWPRKKYPLIKSYCWGQPLWNLSMSNSSLLTARSKIRNLGRQRNWKPNRKRVRSSERTQHHGHYCGSGLQWPLCWSPRCHALNSIENFGLQCHTTAYVVTVAPQTLFKKQCLLFTKQFSHLVQNKFICSVFVRTMAAEVVVPWHGVTVLTKSAALSCSAQACQINML